MLFREVGDGLKVPYAGSPLSRRMEERPTQEGRCGRCEPGE